LSPGRPFVRGLMPGGRGAEDPAVRPSEQERYRVAKSRTSFHPGESGNPGGRPKGLERYTREKVGDDGNKLVDFWIGILDDEDAAMRDRLEASKLLAVRGFGQPAQLLEFTPETGPIE